MRAVLPTAGARQYNTVSAAQLTACKLASSHPNCVRAPSPNLALPSPASPHLCSQLHTQQVLRRGRQVHVAAVAGSLHVEAVQTGSQTNDACGRWYAQRQVGRGLVVRGRAASIAATLTPKYSMPNAAHPLRAPAAGSAPGRPQASCATFHLRGAQGRRGAVQW